MASRTTLGIILDVIVGLAVVVGLFQGLPAPTNLYDSAIAIVGFAAFGVIILRSRDEPPAPVQVEVKYPSAPAPELPKIQGEIAAVMTGAFANPENPSQRLTSFVSFVSLTNASKTPAVLSDWEFYINDGTQFEKMSPPRKIPEGFPFTFEYHGRTLEIQDFTPRLLNRMNRVPQPIKLGTSVKGFVWFGGDLKFFKSPSQARRYRAICIDQFGQRHEILGEPATFRDVGYIADAFGVKGL